MNSLQIFNNPEFGDVRAAEVNEVSWFVGKDVALALGYKDTDKAVRTHVDDEDKRIFKPADLAGLEIPNRGIVLINESGVYSLVFGSKLEEARKFKHWVTSTILPALRKNGLFTKEENYLALPTDYPSALRALADSYEENEKLKIENHKLKTYVDTILESNDALTMTPISKVYDMTCQQANKIAHDEGIQYKVNDQWVLYKKYMGKGYTTSETFCKETEGMVITKVYTKWTQKGRLMLHEVFTKRGILPHMDKEIVNS